MDRKPVLHEAQQCPVPYAAVCARSRSARYAKYLNTTVFECHDITSYIIIFFTIIHQYMFEDKVF
jgi:hypothetical protein